MSAAARLQAGDLLTDREVEQLLTWLAYQRGGFDADEASALVGWARQVRREQRRLDEVLHGDGADLVAVLTPVRRRRHLELVR